MNEVEKDANALPTTRTLVRSTFAAAAVAVALLVSAVLPAEYGYDPIGVGKVLGLTEMGQIKMQLAQEASTDAIVSAVSSGAPSVVGEPESEWRDSMTVVLAPNKGIELKLVMTKGQQAMYEWSADSAEVSYNAHGEPPNPPKGFSHSYGRGLAKGRQGDLVAAFDGHHGWYWRNRSDVTVRVTLKTRGEYKELIEIK
jgi:hypothetical protein